MSLSSTIEQPGSAAANDVDGGTVAQEVDADELLSASQLASITGSSSSSTVTRPWLRTQSLNKATNFAGPKWLTGWENWVYVVVALVVALVVAGGLYWHFKK